MKTTAIILAAGKGTRMRSALPKVLHKLADLSLLEHVYNTAKCINAEDVGVIYGHGGDIVRETLAHIDAIWIEQMEQLGTGHAVQQAVPHIDDDSVVLILYGDVPLTSKASLEALVTESKETGFSLLTVKLNNPTGYGRIVRDSNGQLMRIVEEKDASEDEKCIDEVNTGMMAVNGKLLKQWLSKLSNKNAQGEYYLTDIVELAVKSGVEVKHILAADEYEVLGVNNRLQLANLERHFQQCEANRLMTEGVTLRDPMRVDVRGKLSVGQDNLFDINVIFEGNVTVGSNVKIGPNVLIRNSTIHDDVEILANTVIENAEIGAGSRIGPFARIRPDTKLAEDVHIGNFVEIKKSTVDQGSKVNHLSYIGDSEIGKGVNIGAGTITCNYDGANKFKTIIEDNVFVGSDTQLIAPLTVQRGATIAAGTTLTKDAPAEQLTLSRSKQTTVSGWKRPVKEPS